MSYEKQLQKDLKLFYLGKYVKLAKAIIYIV